MKIIDEKEKVGRHRWDVHPLPHHTNSDGPTERYQFIRTLMAPPKDINQVIILMPFSMYEYALHHEYAC